MISEVRQIQKASKPVWKVHARLDFWFPADARGDRDETGEDREEEGPGGGTTLCMLHYLLFLRSHLLVCRICRGATVLDSNLFFPPLTDGHGWVPLPETWTAAADHRPLLRFFGIPALLQQSRFVKKMFLNS